jgi:D-3-phosphoglycerate dehydrogenase / 2-oxoglutarate reductase
MNGKILRLNAGTFPMDDEERRILASAGAQVIEVENAEECDCLDEIDAVMIVAAYLRTDVVKKLTRCRIISRMGTGCDKIDIEEATRQGIFVTNVPDALTTEVADHTMALLLSAHRRLKYFESCMRAGVRPSGTPEVKNMRRLSTQTLSIVGFGRIGRAVVERAKAFGMRILVLDPVATADQLAAFGAQAADLETILKESDYLSLLCPLTPATRGMLAMAEFKKMKPSAVLINTGRGELVNEKDLAEALKTGVIAYAGIDTYGDFNVFTEGGFPTNHSLFGVRNVQMTPHVAAVSREASEDVVRTATQAVVDVASGKMPTFIVNPAVLDGLRKYDL